MPLREFRNKAAAINEPFKPEIKLKWSDPFPLGRDGVNTRLAATELSPGQSPSMVNALIEMDCIRRSWGYTESAGTDLPITDSDKVIRAIALHHTLAGNLQLVVATNDYIYVTSDFSDWDVGKVDSAAAMTGSGLVDMHMVQDKLIVATNDDNLLYYDGTAGNDALNLLDTTNTPEGGVHLAAFADRCIVANHKGAPQKIAWSISGDITDWSGTGSGNVTLVDTPGHAVDEITGLSVNGDILVVYRRHSVWVGQRTGKYSPALAWSYRHGTGCIAPRSLTNIGARGDIYLGRDNVYLYHPRMGEPVEIGTPIQKTIFDNLNQAQLDNVHAAFVEDEQKYYLFCPEGTDTYADRVYIFDVRRYKTDQSLVWSIKNLNGRGDSISASAGERTDLTSAYAIQKLLLGSSIGECFDSDSSDTTDDGGEVEMTYESPDFTVHKTFLRIPAIGISYTCSSNSEIEIASSVDGGTSWTNDKTYTLHPASSPQWATLWLRHGFGQKVRFRLKTTSDAKFYQYRLGLAQRGMIRRSA